MNINMISIIGGFQIYDKEEEEKKRTKEKEKLRTNNTIRNWRNLTEDKIKRSPTADEIRRSPTVEDK